MIMNQGREPSHILVPHGEALLSELREGGVHIKSVPQNDDIHNEAQSIRLIFPAFPVTLPQFSAFSVEDGACEGVSAFAPIQLK